MKYDEIGSESLRTILRGLNEKRKCMNSTNSSPREIIDVDIEIHTILSVLNKE